MRPVEISEVKNIADYELARPELRPRMMALKDRRRVPLGPHLTFLFENRETVLYQVQEMMRIERIVKPEQIAHEVETYNELIPAAGQLSATLLVEFEDARERDRQLRQLVGLERHIWIEVGGKRVPARFDQRQMDDVRLSSVQYVKWQLDPEQVAAFPLQQAKVVLAGGPVAQGVRLIADHPNYQAQYELSAEQREELQRDLTAK